jgi:Ca2+-binding EF-hand superfamily protein
LEEIFSRLDTNHDDAIDRDELKTGLKGLGIGFSEKKIDEMFRIADLDHNGAISVSEFTKFFGTLPKLLQVSSSSIEQRANPDATDSFLHTGDLPKTLRSIYDEFEKTKDGKLDWKDFKVGVERHGLDAAAVSKQFELADKDGDGIIDFAEFSAHFASLPFRGKVAEPLPGDKSKSKDLMQLFGSLSLDENRNANLESVKQGLKNAAIELPESKVEMIFQQADSNEDGLINEEDFTAYFVGQLKHL